MPSPWKDARGITVTTTPTIEGQPIQDYLGIVTGEVIVGANLFRDLDVAGIAARLDQRLAEPLRRRRLGAGADHPPDGQRQRHCGKDLT